MRKLKIAQIVNIWQSVPPVGYGGTERVVYDITEGLVKRGHNVTLFATGNSKTSATLSSFFPEQLMGKDIPWNNYLYPFSHFYKTYDAIKTMGDFDIIHTHYSIASDLLSMGWADISKIPAVVTLHTVLPTFEKHKDRMILFEQLKRLQYVPISNLQRTMKLNYADTVYHGIDLGEFPFLENQTHDHLMWLGRIVPEKGIEVALDVSAILGEKLIVAYKVDRESKANFGYFQTDVERRLKNPLVEPLGEIDNVKRNDLLSRSKCFLFPIRWEEPFGLVMIEALACGTPVVAFAQGSVPEVIVDGVTGFIVNISNEDRRGDWIVKETGLDGFVNAIKKIIAMNKNEYDAMRKACRRHVEGVFTLEKMIDGYERVYGKILQLK